MSEQNDFSKLDRSPEAVVLIKKHYEHLNTHGAFSSPPTPLKIPGKVYLECDKKEWAFNVYDKDNLFFKWYAHFQLDLKEVEQVRDKLTEILEYYSKF
jgi:hypothetical protein